MLLLSNSLKHNGFKLISLELKANSLVGGGDLFYNFLNQDSNQDEIYTTVLIGPNGTGKSNLFRIVLEILKQLHDFSLGRKRTSSVNGRYSLIYSHDGDEYEFGTLAFLRTRSLTSFTVQSKPRQTSRYLLLKNGEKIKYQEAKLPEAIVASPIMLTDKYPFFKKFKTEDGKHEEAFKAYKYLGVRNIAQNASTRAYVRKTVEFIVAQKESSEFREGLLKATGFLELDKKIEIYYSTSNTHKFFKGNLEPEQFHNYFVKIKSDYSEKTTSPPYKLQQYLSIADNDKLIQQICHFCNRLVNEERLVDMSPSSIKQLKYDVVDDFSLKILQSEFEMIEQLRQLGMLYAPEIELFRNDGYSLKESSSGEYHFFSSIVGLMATVRSNSLVLIDEPEISLHPNWQMKYLAFLRELFSSPQYATSHILIATHSHFILSDLKKENSKIIGLKRVDRKIEIVDLPSHLNTYGWSAEDILYNVFNVRSSLNYYLQADLTELLGMVSNEKKDVSRIEQILDKLKELPTRENDPLQEIISDASTYLESIK